MIELGINTNCLGPATITEVVRIAENLNVQHIEVGPVVKRDLAAFRAIQHDGPVHIHSLIYGRNFLTDDQALRREYRDKLRETIDLAHAVGIQQITTSTGVMPHLTLDENIATALEFWQPIFEETADAGIRIALEFCPTIGNFALGPYMWRPLFTATTSFPTFGLNYDPAHLIWQMIDPYTPLTEFAGKIFSVHAKDCTIHQDILAEHGITTAYRSLQTMPHGLIEERPIWYSQRLPGDGDLDWARFVDILKSVNYSGVILVEHEDPRYLGLRDNVLHGLRRSLNHLRTILGKGSPYANG